MAGLKVRTSGLSHRKSREDCGSSAMRSLGCEPASLNGEGYLGQACVRAGGTCRLVWVWHQEFGGTVKVWVGSFIRLVNAYCRMGFKGQMIDPENLGFQKEGGFKIPTCFPTYTQTGSNQPSSRWGKDKPQHPTSSRLSI